MNIARWTERWARAVPDKVALRFEDQELSYAQFDETIKICARMLLNGLGVRTGDRVAYLGQNHPQLLVLLFACARLGAILVPLNWRLAPRELLYMIRDCGAIALIVDTPYIEQCEALRSEVPGCTFVALYEDAPATWSTLPGLLRNAKGEDHFRGVGLDQPLLIVYTSGTSGAPKGVVLAQQAILANALNSTLMQGMTGEDTILTVLPLFHVGGLTIQTMTAFYHGATVILHRVFDPQPMLDCLVQDKPTLTVILPAQMRPLRQLPGWEAATLQLRAVVTGSCVIPDDMVRYWSDRGIPLLNMYGASETAPVAIHQSMSDVSITAGTVGFPAMHCEIRIVDEAGRDCDVDEPGEILVRGPNVMSRYWGNDDETRRALVEGWFHTGDIGVIDSKGRYRIVDRKKDIIISGGENISPSELENVLLTHPDVLEAAVVGRKDAKWDEVPVAVVVVHAGRQLDKEAVLNWFNNRLGRYKHPKDVVFVDALPRNEMRKVVKQTLRDMVAS